MNDLKIGFAEVNIDPPLGIGIGGYYVPRFASDILDSLFVQAIALECAGERVVLVSIDNCYVIGSIVKEMRNRIEERTGLPGGRAFISATHTHTAPLLTPSSAFEADEELIAEYRELLVERTAEAVEAALADLTPGRMGYATGYAPARVAYIRRYRMKDGSTFTCPPINDENIVGPIGEPDERVHILRFDREGKESVVLVNYGVHADTVNGDRISADWPCHLRRTVAAALDGTKCMFIAGAQGDVGSTNVHPISGDMNDTEISFDNEMKSPGMARFVGRALAGTVLQVYDKVTYTDVESIELIERILPVPANKPTPEQIPLAREYKKLHDEGRDDLIPYTAMELTTAVAEAIRIVEMEDAPDNFMLRLLGVRIGGVALVGIPGEPFTEVGVKIKEHGGFDMIMPCALTNGYAGYFPVKSAYDEGGYEARASRYRSGVAERIVECSQEILDELKK